ncbi:MAG: photosystem I assembly protein Ycf4 [Leptolyngbyaceae bacterium]|nr:photosystem I assembly protein Ycf4 [Leptolyngbyaceae bacterium]
MTAQVAGTSDRVLHQPVLGARRLSNYWWATITTLGATGFLLSGISSYLKINLLPFADPTQLIFVPQGIAMGFYGVVGLTLGTYLWLISLWDVGGGFNEFNRETGEVKIFRWGYPGKDRRIEITAPLSEVQAIRVDIKEGLNPRRALYLRTKGRRDIPLTPVGQPIALSDLENQAAEFARFLGVPLEGL